MQTSPEAPKPQAEPNAQKAEDGGAEFEEEDDFEEFAQQDWGDAEDEGEQGAWTADWTEQGWDEEDVDDSFAEKLKQELDKHTSKIRSQAPPPPKA